MTALVIACLSAGAARPQGAAVSEREGHKEVLLSYNRGSITSPSRSETCRDARRGLAYYIRARHAWRAKMGAGNSRAYAKGERVARSCSYIRAAARRVRASAVRARARYERWVKAVRDEWNWRAWLPAKFYRVARCETGVDWRFDSGTYVSAFGIIRVAFPTWNGHNSPREQYEVAAGIQRRYGWGAWGCGGA